MPTPRELLAAAKARDHRGHAAPRPRPSSAAPRFLDVRERDEYDQGAMPRRGPRPAGPAGVQRRRAPPRQGRARRHLLRRRRALGVRGARTLQELGYTDVVSMAGGFNRWKDDGLEFEVPRTLSRRPARPLPAPPAAARGRRAGPAHGCSTPRSSCSARAGSARPRPSTSPRRASARSASSTWTSSTPRTCSVRSCTTSTAVGERKVDSAKKTLTAMNPDVERRDLRRPPRRRTTCCRSSTATT